MPLGEAAAVSTCMLAGVSSTGSGQNKRTPAMVTEAARRRPTGCAGTHPPLPPRAAAMRRSSEVDGDGGARELEPARDGGAGEAWRWGTNT
nr:unnamed protein product [Digitaria exilis]